MIRSAVRRKKNKKSMRPQEERISGKMRRWQVSKTLGHQETEKGFDLDKEKEITGGFWEDSFSGAMELLRLTGNKGLIIEVQSCSARQAVFQGPIKH